MTNLRRELDDLIFRKKNAGRVRTSEKYTQTYQPRIAEKFSQTSDHVAAASSSRYISNGSLRRRSQDIREGSREGYSSKERYNSKESYRDGRKKEEQKTSRDENFRDSKSSRKRSRSPRDKSHKNDHEKRRKREELPVRDTHKEPDLREKILKKKAVERQKSDDEKQRSRSREKVADVHMLDTELEISSVVIKQEASMTRNSDLSRNNFETEEKSSEIEKVPTTLESAETSRSLLTSAPDEKSETMELIGDLIESMSQDGSTQTRCRMKRLSDALNESHESSLSFKIDKTEERETVEEAAKKIVEAVTDPGASQQFEGDEQLLDLDLLESEKKEILKSLDEEMVENENEPEKEMKNCHILIAAKSVQNAVELTANDDFPVKMPTVPSLPKRNTSNHPGSIEDGEICDDSSNEIPAVPQVTTKVNKEFFVEMKSREEKVIEKPEKFTKKSTEAFKTSKSTAKNSKTTPRNPTSSRQHSKKSEVSPSQRRKLNLDSKKAILEPHSELPILIKLPNAEKSPSKPINSLLIPKNLKADEVSGGIQSVSLMLGNFEETSPESMDNSKKSNEAKISEEKIKADQITAAEKLTNLKKNARKSTKKSEEIKKQAEFLKLQDLRVSKDLEIVEELKNNQKIISMPKLVDVPDIKHPNPKLTVSLPTPPLVDPNLKLSVPKTSQNPNFKISIPKPPNLKLSILQPPYHNPSKKFLVFESPEIIKNNQTKQAAIKKGENSKKPSASSSQLTAKASKIIRETSKLRKDMKINEKFSSELKNSKESKETSKLTDLKSESMRIEPENVKSPKKFKQPLKSSPRILPKSSPGKSSPAKISESTSKHPEDPPASSTAMNVCPETSIPPNTSPSTANDSLDSTTKENSLNGSQINSIECQTKRRSYTKEVMDDGVVVITMSRRKKKKKLNNC